ncbi:MAG: DUF4276 family protein [Syntrophobacteraceae bacterium]|jgi:hypothetical protein
MKISLLIEGRTEKGFLPHLRLFLETRLHGRMPNIDPFPYHGRVPKGEKLKRVVENLLSDGDRASDAVVALTDVYTGTREFNDAADAKAKMRAWVGPETRFHPHAAQHDFEAWLLVYWADIVKLARHNRKPPGKNPEDVNHDKPPAHRIQALFEVGSCRGSYVKPRDANKILQGKDLLLSANACPELKGLLNTILRLCDGEIIP